MCGDCQWHVTEALQSPVYAPNRPAKRRPTCMTIETQMLRADHLAPSLSPFHLLPCNVFTSGTPERACVVEIRNR
jgi:hypothetical protein